MIVIRFPKKTLQYFFYMDMAFQIYSYVFSNLRHIIYISFICYWCFFVFANSRMLFRCHLYVADMLILYVVLCVVDFFYILFEYCLYVVDILFICWFQTQVILFICCLNVTNMLLIPIVCMLLISCLYGFWIMFEYFFIYCWYL